MLLIIISFSLPRAYLCTLVSFRIIIYHRLCGLSFYLWYKSRIVSMYNVCGRIRTFGAFQHTSLAGKHHRPLGHANIVGRIGLEPTEPESTRFTVWPATNYGLPTHRVPDETRTRNRWNHNPLLCHLSYSHHSDPGGT